MYLGQHFVEDVVTGGSGVLDDELVPLKYDFVQDGQLEQDRAGQAVRQGQGGGRDDGAFFIAPGEKEQLLGKCQHCVLQL